jgi:hypothetical protein
MYQDQELGIVEYFKMIADIAIEKDKNFNEEELPLIITQTIKVSNYFPLITPNLVSVRTSSRHGRGVFANQAIKKGEIVCLYPENSVLVNIQNGKEGWLSYDKDNIFDNHYSMNILEEKQICADPTKYTSLFSAHMINDSVSCETIEKLKDIHSRYDTCDYTEFGKGINRYLLETKKNSNVDLIPSKHMCYVKASKNIQPNEELLTSYGFPYWLNGIDWNSKYAMYLANINETQRNLFLNLLTDTHLTQWLN